MDWTEIPGILELLDGPPATDAEIAWKYRARCVWCLGRADGIHELVPRSLCAVIGKDPMSERNRVPLCALDHDWAQVDPISKALRLRERADSLLKSLT